MKQKFYFFTLLLFSSLLSITALAQTREYYTYDINGFIWTQRYTTQDIINKFGQPSFYDPLSKDTGEGQEGRREFFDYNDGFNISLNGYGEVTGAFIKTPKYTLFKGYLKVGDHISKLNLLHQLGVGRLEQLRPAKYHFFMEDNYLELVLDQKQQIVTIHYFVPF